MDIDFSSLVNNFIKSFLSKELDIYPDFPFMVVLALVGAVILGSGFYAAALAEEKEHNRLVHFLLGLLLPWVYPIAIYGPVRGAAKKKKKSSAPKREEPQESPPGVVEYAETESRRLRHMTRDELVDTISRSQSVEDIEFTQRTFTTLAAAKFGESAGPYYFKLVDGNVIKVRAIAEIQPTFLVVEIESGEGKARTLRLLYAKIHSFSLSPDSFKNGIETVPRSAQLRANAEGADSEEVDEVTARVPMLEREDNEPFTPIDTVVDKPAYTDNSLAKPKKPRINLRP